jgi:hypothetical protein
MQTPRLTNTPPNIVNLAAGVILIVLVFATGWVNLIAPLATLGLLVYYLRRLDAPLRRLALRSAALAALTAWPLMVMTHVGQLYWEGPPPYNPDELNYLRDSERVADLWVRGDFPNLTSKYIIGSLHTGYERVGALLYIAWGPGVGPFLLVNALLLPLIGAVSALLTIELKRKPCDNSETQQTRGSPSDASAVALPTLALAVMHPVHAFWATFVLRETLHLTALLLVLLTATVAIRRAAENRFGWITFWLGMTICWSFTIRSYTTLILLAVLALWYLSCERGVRFMPWIGIGTFAFFIMFFHPTTGRVLNQLLDTLASLAPDFTRGPVGVIKHMAGSMPRLLWGPFPWNMLDEFSMYYLLYPALWVQVLLVWPRLVPRIVEAKAWDAPQALFYLLIATFGLCIVIAFRGDAPRHAYPLFVFAALALNWPVEKSTISRVLVWLYWAALLGFILMQQGMKFQRLGTLIG